MYEQRACFFAWLIMPFNSTSTMPFHRIISQWSGVFLLSHALFSLSPPPSLQNESWIQPSLLRGERQAGGRADQSRASEANAFCCAALIDLQDNFPFGLQKIKRLVWGSKHDRLQLCFSFSYQSRSSSQSKWPLCLWRSYNISHNVKWDHGWPAIPSLASPLSASWQFQVSVQPLSPQALLSSFP